MKINAAHRKLTKLLKKGAQAAPPPDAGITIVVDDGTHREEVIFQMPDAANPIANLLGKNN